MQNSISYEQQSALKQILAGLSYLANEAEGSDLLTIAGLIKKVTSDILYWVENQEDGNQGGSLRLLGDNSLLMAIEFLAKYASVKDDSIRQEIIEKIEELQANYDSFKHGVH